MEVVNCMRDGMIYDWNLFEKLLDYSYEKCLFVNSECHPVLFSESPLNINANKEKLTEIMFEKYNVPAIILCNNAVLASLSYGCLTGLVLDSGATHTTAVPVLGGFPMSSALVNTPLGGNFISMKCRQFLNVCIIILI